MRACITGNGEGRHRNSGDLRRKSVFLAITEVGLEKPLSRLRRTDPSYGGPRFESVSLQQRVRLSQESIFVGQEPRLSARVCPAAFPVRSTESRGARPHRTNPQQYLCRAIFQYRISGDAVTTSRCVRGARLVPNEVGLSLGLGGCWWILRGRTGLKQSRARSADRASLVADVSARAASAPSDRAVGAHRESLG